MTRHLARLLSVTIFVLIGSGLSRPARAQGLPVELFSLLTAATSAPSYTVTDLGTLGGSYSVPFGINNAGLVAGNSFTANYAAVHSFLIGGGLVKDLGTLGGPNSGANAVNTAGQVAGYSYLTDGQTFHASLWTGGTMRDLGTLGGTLSTASGVNDSGQVCGSSYLSGDNMYHAFLWINGAMKDLAALDSKAGIGPTAVRTPSTPPARSSGLRTPRTVSPTPSCGRMARCRTSATGNLM